MMGKLYTFGLPVDVYATTSNGSLVCKSVGRRGQCLPHIQFLRHGCLALHRYRGIITCMILPVISSIVNQHVPLRACSETQERRTILMARQLNGYTSEPSDQNRAGNGGRQSPLTDLVHNCFPEADAERVIAVLNVIAWVI